MSVLPFERSTAGHDAWRAVADRIGTFVRRVRRDHKARRDRRHLMQLPDYLLRDIGLSRIEVEAMTERRERPRFVVFPDVGWRQEP